MNVRHLLRTSLLTSLLALCALQGHTEDIDIYNGVQSNAPPNLLMILDNSAAADSSVNSFTCPVANLPFDGGKVFGIDKCAIYNAVSSIVSNPVLYGNINLGLMYFPQSGKNAPPFSSGGQFVVPAYSPTPSVLPLMNGTAPTLTANSASGGTGGIGTMLTSLFNLSLANNKSNNNQMAQTMQESWAFYGGHTGLSGLTYPGVSSANCAKKFVLYITAAAGNGNGNATKPQDPGGLAASALNTAYASASGGSSSYPQIVSPQWPLTWKSPISGVTASSKYQSDPSDEWAQFMSRYNNAITTYTIILSDGTNPDYEQAVVSMASNSGGKYFIINPNSTSAISQLTNALTQIFLEVQAVNSVFAAPVLPVSSNAQGSYANQVFIGMFRPDPHASPRWMGNLKQYRMGVNTTDAFNTQLYLADASWGPYPSGFDSNAALSSAGTGFISPSAVSFWTSKDTSHSPDAYGGFWTNATTIQGGKDGYDWADGQIVEKGGVSQRLRLRYLTNTSDTSGNYSTTIPLYTCTTSGCSNGSNTTLSSMPFSATTASSSPAIVLDFSKLVANAVANIKQLIGWTLGRDPSVVSDTLAGAEMSAPPVVTSPDTAITVRGSIHGDVLHSRPAVVNYGGTTGVVVFYGANDGVFRAVNGNQPPSSNTSPAPLGTCTLSNTCAIGTTEPGGTLWGFIAPEFYTSQTSPKPNTPLGRLYLNSPSIGPSVLNADGTFATRPKPYFFDGSPSYYQDFTTDPNNKKVWLFLSARRGGRLLYALDVSNPTAPKFKWKLDNTATGMSELGQTWSQPKVAFLKGYSHTVTVTNADGTTTTKTVAKPVLIFGAGYDQNEDGEPPGCTDYTTDPPTKVNDPICRGNYNSANANASRRSDTMGRGIFVLDADTGALLWSASASATTNTTTCTSGTNACNVNVPGMTHAIPADVTLVDRDYDGYIDRLYTADTGGNVWRVDMQPTGTGAFNTWRVTQIAALGGLSTDPTPRKFFYPPDVAPGKTYDAVLAITGDREHPTYTTQSYKANAIINRFYMLKDVQGMSETLTTPITDATSSTSTDTPTNLFNATSATYDGSGQGFFVSLAGGAGEKGVNAPTAFGGVAYFGTNQPQSVQSGQCNANLGVARSYSVNYLTGAFVSNVLDGGGLPPSPVTGFVNVTVNGQDVTLPFVIGGPGSQSAFGAVKPTIPINSKRYRTYWYREKDQ